MTNKIETLIFSKLITDEEYTRKVFPYLKKEYFKDKIDQSLFDVIYSYFVKYNSMPSESSIKVEIENVKNLSQSEFVELKKLCKEVYKDIEVEKAWILDKTEEFCKDSALYIALSKAVELAAEEKGNVSKGMIPQLLSDALGVSFDTNIGHDYFNELSDRYKFYHEDEVRIPFDLDILNKITQGGLPKKTFTIIAAGTGGGKSMFMCHNAAFNLMSGYNVLYITCEMSEERIAERIDANLLDIPVNEIKHIPEEMFNSKLLRLKAKTIGKLIIKEYPTTSASVIHFKNLLSELKVKKNFKPDIIYVDYLNICASARFNGSNINMYSYVKSISEELRGLAVEQEVPLITATQFNRTGYSDTDADLTSIADSFGSAMTADLILGMISTEEFDEQGLILFKQSKNRFGDPNKPKRFMVGIDKARMKFYDVEDDTQSGLMDSPVMSKTTFGLEQDKREKTKGFM